METQETSGKDLPRIGLITVGGGGLRIAGKIKDHIPSLCELLLVDTDARAISSYPGLPSLRIGKSLLRGLGCGGDPELGKLALQSDRPKLTEFIKNKDLLLVLGCLGKGCATGALPEITALVGESRIPSFVVVSTPFEFEGKNPAKLAREAIVRMRKSADAIVELPNDLLLQEGGTDDRADQLFDVSDHWMAQVVRSVVGPFHMPGLLSVDIATFRAALAGAECRTLFGVARTPLAEDEPTILRTLFRCPLLAGRAERMQTDQLLISIGSSGDLSTEKFASLTYKLAEQFQSKRKTVCGVWKDPSLGDDVEISIFARTALGENEGFSRGLDRVPVHQSKLAKNRRDNPKPREQIEFTSLVDHNERGNLSSGEVEQYAGIDLDKPTFLRRGIKIQLPKI